MCVRVCLPGGTQFLLEIDSVLLQDRSHRGLVFCIATGPSETGRPWRHWGRLTGAIPANPRDLEVGNWSFGRVATVNLTDFLIGLSWAEKYTLW